MPILILLLALCIPLLARPPGVLIDHHPASTRQYIGSPSIAILPDGSYVASHDFFGSGSTQSTSAVTRIFRSTDRGATWRKAAEMSDQFWSNLFVHRGKLYLMGTTYEYGRIVIRASQDGGVTWTGPSYLSADTNFHTAPVPVAIHHGRIWRAMEFHPTGPWGFFEAFLLSAPVKSNLLDPASWRLTQRLKFPAGTEGQHWLEGNAIVSRDGQLFDVLRVDNIEKAAIVKLDGETLKFDRLVDFPGGAKKFTIRYDRRTHRYWTISNPAPAGAQKPASIRNKLALMSSKDLLEWRVERTLMSHPDAATHGFQYVDWQFDGKDIVTAIRTAFDDDSGGAHNFHDANYLTFYRVTSFRRPQ